MKYVIYGAGYRGRKAYNYIGSEKVVAFIDINKEKQGKEYCGKPVISIEEYIKMYFTCFIIITPVCINNIEKILEKHNIYQYCNLSGMPSEFAGYGNCKFEDSYKELMYNHELYCCYGFNVLSFMLYDNLCPQKEVYMCPEKKCRQEKLQWIRKYHPEINVKTYSALKNKEIVLMSVIGENEEKFCNKTINLFEYASNNRQYFNDKLLRFKNIYKNKKCFIVATGPSLRIEDLHKLRANNVVCFGVNSILKIEKEWVADIYVASDSRFISDNIRNIQNYNCVYKFIGDSCEEYWKTAERDSYKIHVTKAGTEIADFSEEISQKIYSGYGGSGTVTYVCIQLAAYMGFAEIYLLGADCNYVVGSKNNYFIAEDAEDHMNHKVNLMIKAYEYAKKYADVHDLKIYNATRGGMLEVFERVNFDSLFEG